MSLNGIKVPVGPTAKGFWPTFKAQTRAGVPTLKVPVNPDLTRLRRELALERKRQEANAINMRVRVDERGRRDLTSLRREVDHIYKVSSSRRALRIQIQVAGAAAIPAAAQGILSLTTAVTELSRVTLLLPGIFSSVASALGTFAIGIGGVTDALKASADGLKNNQQYARDYARATRDVERAQRDVVQALKDANREIDDQKDKLKSGQLSAEQASINVRRANERLAQGGFKSMSDWQQALLDVKQAQFDFGQTMKQNGRDIQDYYDNTVRGATETDRFKDSVDQLNNTMDAYTKAQLQAAGMSEKFINAMDSLSPKAQMFVRQIVGLRGAWRDLTNQVQDNLFDGLGKSVTDLANARLPMLKQRMGEIATSLNGDFKQLFASLGSDKNADGISKIFDRTAKALAIAQPGINSFVNAFVHLSEVGSRFMPRFAQAFDTLGKRFDSFVNRADADGSLERWMNRGIETVNSLFNAMGSLGSIFGSITRAYETATGNVGGFATTLEKTLGKWAAKLASPAGQLQLRGYIKYAGEFMTALKESLPGILNLVQAVADGLRFFGATIMPIISTIGNFAAKHTSAVRLLVFAYAGIRTVKPLWENMLKIIRKIGEGFTSHRALIRAYKDEEIALGQEKMALANQEQKYQNQFMQATRNRSRAVSNFNKVSAIGSVERMMAIQKIRQAEAELAKSQGSLNVAKATQTVANGPNVTVTSGQVTAAQDRVAASQKKLSEARKNYNTVTVNAANSENAAMRRISNAHGVLLSSQKKLNVVQDEAKNISKRLATATDELSGDSKGFGRLKRSMGNLKEAIGSQGKRGLAGSLGGLISVVGTVVGSIAGAAGTVGLIYALDQLATAQQKAGDRTQYHLDKLTALKNELDPATGAVTAAGTAASLERAQETQLTGKGNNTLTVNALTDAEKLGISAQQLGSSFDPSQMAATSDTLKKADANTLAAVVGGKDEQWNRIKDDAQSRGITAEIYAKALNGDQDAVKKFNAWREDWWKRDNRWNILGKLPMKVAPKGYIPDLGQGTENLYQTTPGISVGQTTRENVEGNRVAGDASRQRAKPGTLSSAGRAKFPNASDIRKQDGGGLAFNVDRLTPQQAQALQEGDPNIPNSSLSLTPLADNGDGTSRYSVIVPPASPYVGYASGGSVWGAGSATSDSIPAMLSNGEFVINAKSASVIGHDNLSALNGIQHFDKGGPAVPIDPNGRTNRDPALSRPILRGGHGSGAKFGSIASTPGGSIAGMAPAKPAPVVPKPPAPVVPKLNPWLTEWDISAKPAPSKAGPAYTPPVPQAGGVPRTTTGSAAPVLRSHGSGSAKYGSVAKDGMLAGIKVGSPVEPGWVSIPAPDGSTRPIPDGSLLTDAYLGLPALKTKDGAPIPRTLAQLASAADPLPYIMGGGHPYYDGNLSKGEQTRDKNAQPFLYGFDCSALVSAAANIAAGLPPNYDVFATGNQKQGLEWRGFLPEAGQPGDLVVGWDAGHTSMRLPDGRIFEAQNPTSGIRIGKPGDDRGMTKPEGFPQVMHLPASLIRNNDLLGNIPLNPAPGGPPAGGPPAGGPPAGGPPAGGPPAGGGPTPGGSGSSEPDAFKDLSGIVSVLGGSGGPSGGLPNPAPPGAPGGVPGPATADPIDPSMVPPIGSGPFANLPPVPGINAPIPGPFGPIPLQPFDFLKSIGMSILQAIFGFFGIDISGLTGIINQVIGGFANMGTNIGDAPDPNVDPGADPEMIRQLNELADQARATGDFTKEGEWRQLAKDYEQRRASVAPGQVDPNVHLGSAAAPGPVKKARGGLIQRLSGGGRPEPIDPNPKLPGDGWFDQDQFEEQIAENWAYEGGPSYNKNGGLIGFKNGGMFPRNSEEDEKWFNRPDNIPSAISPIPHDPLPFIKWNYPNLSSMFNAAGGHIRGPGTGTSDSIPAMLSNGEYVLRADAVRKIGVPRLNKLNSVGKYAGGGPIGAILPEMKPPPPPPVVPPPTSGSSDPQAFQDLSAIPSPDIEGARKVGAQLGSFLTPKGGASGVSAGARQPAPKDPRAILAQAPTSSDHNNPAFSGAIEGAFSTIGSLAGTAASLAISGVSGGAGAIGGSAAAAGISAGAQMGGQIASGALNILSSLLVGTVTPPETGQGYGAPMTPQAPQNPMTNFQSIHNGNVVTNNLTEYNRLKDRKDAQKAAPFFNRVKS